MTHMLVDEQYAAQNALLHRRPPMRIRAPAMVWHLGFWKPADQGAEEWIKSVDRVLFAIHQQCTDVAGKANVISPSYSEPSFYGFRNEVNSRNEGLLEQIEGSRSHELIHVVVMFKHVMLQLSAELSKEFWTLTVVMEKPWKTNRNPPKDTVRGEEDLAKLLEEILELGISNTADRISEHTSAIEFDAKRAHSTLLAWIQRNIFNPVWNSLGGPTLSPWGRKFFDFRGLIAPFGNSEHHDAPKEASIVRQLLPTALPGRKDWIHHLTRIWPVIKSLQARHEKGDSTSASSDPLVSMGFWKPEVSVSNFQGRRVLYVSSIGATSPNPLLSQGESTIPPFVVRYVIIAAHQNPWQLGRVIDRLHRAGAMRVAAVRDLAGVFWCNNKLDEIKSRINNIVALSGRSDERGTFEKHVLELHRELVGVQDAHGRIQGGLEFRCHRSGYYVDQFKKLVSALRISRVEGFQRYDQYVERRIGANFETIRLSYQRYTECRREIDILLQRSQAERALEIQVTLASLSEASLRTTESTDAQTKSINMLTDQQIGVLKRSLRLTKRAELFLLITIAYYGGTIIGTWLEYFGVGSKYAKSGAYFLTCLGALGVYSLWARRLKPRSTPKKSEV